MPDNHNSAEIYEVLLTVGLAERLGVPTNVTEKDLSEKLSGVGETTVREEERAPVGIAVLLKDVKRAAAGRGIERVDWTGGGERSSHGTAADLQVTFSDGELLGYQLKSVGSGLGTMRNPYNDELMRQVGTNSDDITVPAFRASLDLAAEIFGARAVATIADFRQLYRFTKSGRNAAKLEDFKVRAKEIYEPVKAQLCERFCAAFNGLSGQRRAEVMLGLMGMVHGEPLHLLVHDDNAARALSHEDLAQFLRRSNLTASVNTNNSLVVLVAGVEDQIMFRLNSSASNSQGVSPPCWRIFYGAAAEVLLDELASG